MSNRYRTSHPTQPQGGYLILKIALGIVLSTLILWVIGTAMGIGTLAFFAKALNEAFSQPNLSTPQQPKVSQLNLGQPSNQLIHPLSPEEIIKDMGENSLKNTRRTQQAMNERIKEHSNISMSNEIYHQKHPEMPRVKNSALRFDNLAQADNYQDTNDTDPHNNPSAWDSIKTKDKICWFHKTTRRKICENNH